MGRKEGKRGEQHSKRNARDIPIRLAPRKHYLMAVRERTNHACNGEVIFGTVVQGAEKSGIQSYSEANL